MIRYYRSNPSFPVYGVPHMPSEEPSLRKLGINLWRLLAQEPAMILVRAVRCLWADSWPIRIAAVFLLLTLVFIGFVFASEPNASPWAVLLGIYGVLVIFSFQILQREARESEDRTDNG
jgi:hypothetical protein